MRLRRSETSGGASVRGAKPGPARACWDPLKPFDTHYDRQPQTRDVGRDRHRTALLHKDGDRGDRANS
ncbi:MAG: hypothetical protein KatS3mg058_2703 [Roseiflexus sp.]|nr:MAG: hypothetical protein KatS3mg058_2703 [Roseiflexus sp.]